jgi:hypothetical protein
MSRLIRLLSPFILFSILMFLNGCKDEESNPSSNNNGNSSGSGNVDDAYAELENQMFVMANSTINGPSDLDKISFVRANSLYKGALAGASGSAAANFGAGFTEIMMIYADPNINAMIKRWDSVSLGKSPAASFIKFGIPSGTKDMAVPTQALAKNMAKIVQVAVVNPPLIGEMQNLMRDNLLPHINYTLARFAVVETDTSFRFKISGKMQGDIQLDSLMLDNTEVYIMDGVLRGIKAMVEQFLVFRFDLTDYTTAAIVQALQPTNTTFFYRASDGVARSQSVLSDVTSMIGKFKGAINYLKSEAGTNQDYDIIKVGTSGPRSVAEKDLDTALVYLDKALTYLTTPQTVTLTDADIDGNDYTIQVNITNLYNNPPQNPKTAWFPAYTIDTSASGSILWHWTNQTYASFTFPDPTFSGLFPGMTNTDLKRILHIDEAFAWRVFVTLYDNTSTLSAATTANLIINGRTYNPNRNLSAYNGREVRFYIMDYDGYSVQVFALLNGTISQSLLLSGPVTVRLGKSTNINVNLEAAPQTITGTGYSYPYTYLYLQNYPNGQYRIERDTTGIPFSVIDSTTSYSYYDYSVVRGKTYHYRAQLIPYSYSYSDYVYGTRTNNYTNTVTVTIP